VHSVNLRDAAVGAIFIAIGALFALGTRELDMGSLLKMGPGFFPLVLAIVLMALGLFIVATSFAKENEPIGAVPWRGLVLILAAPVVFGSTVRGLGLVGALVLAVVISTFASKRATVLLSALLTLGLTVFCVAVFSYGLGLPLRLVGPWLKF
jgi:uncharacterized membrane protein